ncbi:response regulator transcription factor [Pedobacter borealis]|uniref:response regulator transcription factor n=1 Tax=Pedobacter borealis TaxID=475254 RepID=UPI001FD7E97D|nr:LuxR C-terminal-related transcriptional regulator [Pedobacter borealis]
MAQNIISYGSGFLVVAYFPCYFYMAFGLRGLRWHVFYGVPMFLMIPFAVSFLVAYPITGSLEYATSYGMIIPGFYALILLFVLLKAIRSQSATESDLTFFYGKPEMYKVYSAVVPWVLMGVFVYLHISQWIQVMVTNSGFLVVTVLCFRKTIRWERARDLQLNAIYIAGVGASIFEHNCAVYSLTARETEISLLISQGMQYKFIADELFISLDTVKSHVKNIFKKVGVNDKTELVYKLGQRVI